MRSPSVLPLFAYIEAPESVATDSSGFPRRRELRLAFPELPDPHGPSA